MVVKFCTLWLLLSWKIFFLQSNHKIKIIYTPSKNEQSKWDNIVFSLIFHMSAYLLLVGSVLVIKLYWWFAFTVLDMRQNVHTDTVLQEYSKSQFQFYIPCKASIFFVWTEADWNTKYVYISINHTKLKC